MSPLDTVIADGHMFLAPESLQLREGVVDLNICCKGLGGRPRRCRNIVHFEQRMQVLVDLTE